MGSHALGVSSEALDHLLEALCERLEGARVSGEEGRVGARVEARSRALWRAVVAECTASFLYVFVVCGAAAGAGLAASTSALLLTTALASGCAIATLTMCFAHVSGAHVSPTVSVSLAVRRAVSPLRAALYVAAQCAGAIAGAAAIYGVGAGAGLGAGVVAVGRAWERLGAELVLSALVAAAHAAAAQRRRAAGAAPLLLGAAYCAATLVNMPSLNPARALGPCFVLSRWESHWVWWVGGVGGGAAAGLLQEWCGGRGAAPRSSRASSPRDLEEADKPAFSAPQYRATYCAAADTAEPLYAGTKSLYCRSPPPARHTLHRSQSVYSKGSGGGSTLTGALRPAHAQLPHLQNAHNAQREPPYGARPGPAGQYAIGASVSERRESVYSGSAAGSGSTAVAGGVGGAGAGGVYGTYRAPPYRHTEHY